MTRPHSAPATARPIGYDANCAPCMHNASRLTTRDERCIDCFTYDGGHGGSTYPFRELAPIPAWDRGPDVLRVAVAARWAA